MACRPNFKHCLVYFFLLIVPFMGCGKKETSPLVRFTNYTAGLEREDAFIQYFLPLIRSENAKITLCREKLQRMYFSKKRTLVDASYVFSTAKDYGLTRFDINKVDDWKALFERVDIVPVSLVLAQGASESEWGTSRYAQEMHNYFGQWCFVEGCGWIPSDRMVGLNYEIARFSSARESFAQFLQSINTSTVYDEFRARRAKLRRTGKALQGVILADSLAYNSRTHSDYLAQIKDIIHRRQLGRYDANKVEDVEIAHHFD